MAWYLSEVVTDLSPIADILDLYEQTGSVPDEDVEEDSEENFEVEFERRLVPLLRKSMLNTDNIDTDTIPAAYENDKYKWLAAGYFDLVKRLDLTDVIMDRSNDTFWFRNMNTGSQEVKQYLPLPDLMKAKLPGWYNDAGVHPYRTILELLAKLKETNLYPCGGLLLLEVLLLLLQINQRNTYVDTYNLIADKRREFYRHMSGEVVIDLIDYSGFLWEQLSQDPSNYHAANYPARSTIQLMMYGGEIEFGPVPDELFGLVQYITIA